MQIDYKSVTDAVRKGILSEDQAKKIWQFWLEEQKDTPRFNFVHILYYLGGLLAISAVTLYVTNAWDRFQGFPLLVLSLFLLMLGMSLTHLFLNKGLRLPAGVMASFSLALVPLIVYNIQYIAGIEPNRAYHYSDFHYWIDWYWVNMELATFVVGIVMLYFYRLPFLLFPVSIILWYMSMDFWPLINNMHQLTYADRALFSMFFGLFILLITVYLDLKYDNSSEDYLFWLYIVGVAIFWGGLSCQPSSSEFSRFIYFVINVAMLFIGAILNRRVFAVFGTFGMLGYLSHLAFTVFANSLGFPVVLVMIGILIILSGVLFTKCEKRMMAMMLPYIPPAILRKMNR